MMTKTISNPQVYIESLDRDLLRLRIDHKDFILDYETSFEILMQLAKVVSRMEDQECPHAHISLC